MIENLFESDGIPIFITDLVELSVGKSDEFDESRGSLRIPEEVIREHSAEDLGQAVKECLPAILVVKVEALVRNIYSQVKQPRSAPNDALLRVLRNYDELTTEQREILPEKVLSRIPEIRAALSQSIVDQ